MEKLGAVIEEPVVAEESDEQILARQQEEAAAFESGYSGTVIPPTDTPADDTPKEPEAKVEVAPTAEPVAPAPTSLTDAQIKDLLAKVGAIDELKGGLEKLRGDFFGKAGGLERTLKQLQESTPMGQPIDVKPEDLAELEADFPGLNLGPSLAKGLTRVLSKMKGTGPAVTPGLTPEEIDARIAARGRQEAAVLIEEERKRNAAERLTDLHEDWQAVVGLPDSQTAFRTWLKGQGTEKEQAFLSSWNPRYIAKQLTAFKESTRVAPKPSPNPNDTRAQRLAEAVPPKGGAVPMPKSKRTEEEEAFEEGYKNR
jgi:hypothetical protein